MKSLVFTQVLTYVKNLFDTTKDASEKRPSSFDFKVYKKLENNTQTALGEKRNNLILFQVYLNIKIVEGLLKQGFKNSKKDCFYQGVYITYISRLFRCGSELLLGCRYFINNNYVYFNEDLDSIKRQTNKQMLKKYYEFNGFNHDLKHQLKNIFMIKVHKQLKQTN